MNFRIGSPKAQSGRWRRRQKSAPGRGLERAESGPIQPCPLSRVALWRGRFRDEGVDCLWQVAPGRGRKTRFSGEKIEAIVKATLETRPAGATHWSCRTLAESQGVSKNTINRGWQSHQLKPHLTETFKLSRDVRFLEKLTDVVGLYLNPPQKALVFMHR
jgi:Homeodomain-like domain